MKLTYFFLFFFVLIIFNPVIILAQTKPTQTNSVSVVDIFDGGKALAAEIADTTTVNTYPDIDKLFHASEVEIAQDTILHDGLSFDSSFVFDRVTTSKTTQNTVSFDSLFVSNDVIMSQTAQDSMPGSSLSTRKNGFISEGIKKQEEISFYDFIVRKCTEMLNDSAVYRALADSRQQTISETDISKYYASPFFIDLIYTGLPLNIQWQMPTDYTSMFHKTPAALSGNTYHLGLTPIAPLSLCSLRKDARNEILRTRIDLYTSIFTQLPNPSKNKSAHITSKPLKKVQFVDENYKPNVSQTLTIQRSVVSFWKKTANAMVQFSQNYVSDNWHQGGSGSMAVLGILTGRLNYDNKKSIQWENNGEWRAGVINVDDTTALRLFNTNDDILKINSKFGLKAGGNWFYSSNLDFSTQFFHNYKAVNSDELKTKFLTPVRMNLGIGMDYKYKSILSVMVAPIAYKFVYANDTTGTGVAKINPNTFGIKTGEKSLHEIGSSFTAQYNYTPFRELQINSKLKFYTNYEKVEIDWEIVGIFMVNRFLTTRISLNPRYDNTVILKEGEKARIQFRELMSFGFSFRLH